MSLLLIAITHRTAPLAVLEQVAVADRDRPDLLKQLLDSPAVTEAMLISTCNRIEVYAASTDTRAARTHVLDVLARHAGIARATLTPHSLTCSGEAAARHLFQVAGGLDSLVLGDEQVLGQVRAGYAAATDRGAAGPVLHPLAQQALRVGKRIHSSTGLARVGASVVQAALEHAAGALPAGTLTGRRAVVVGAGAMGALAVAHLQRRHAREVLVVNRTPSRASELATSTDGSAVRALALQELPAALTAADVVVACTSADGTVISLAQIAAALRERPADRGPLVVCDLGLPRNVDPAVAAMPGVVLLTLQSLHGDRQTEAQHLAVVTDLPEAARIVADAVRAYSARRRAARAAPAVVALREQAAAVVQAELAHLDRRLPDLDPATRHELTRAVRRVADKLLHAPTVALQQLPADLVRLPSAPPGAHAAGPARPRNALAAVRKAS